MERTVTYCDICGKPDAKVFSFAVDRENDGAGSMETVHNRVDLCIDHTAAQLLLLIESLSWSNRAALARQILKDKSLFMSGLDRGARFRGGVVELEQPLGGGSTPPVSLPQRCPTSRAPGTE